MGLKLYSGEEMKKMIEKTGFSDIEINYYQAFKVPLKCYIFPKCMIAKAI